MQRMMPLSMLCQAQLSEGTTYRTTLLLDAKPKEPLTVNLATPSSLCTVSAAAVVLDALNYGAGVELQVDLALNNDNIERPLGNSSYVCEVRFRVAASSGFAFALTKHTEATTSIGACIEQLTVCCAVPWY